jgi:hypothetical protein
MRQIAAYPAIACGDTIFDPADYFCLEASVGLVSSAAISA